MGILHYKQGKMVLNNNVSHRKSHGQQEKPYSRRRHSHVLTDWAELEPQRAVEHN